MDREKRIEEMTKCCIYNDNGKCNADATESNECDLMCKMYGMFANLEMAGYLKQREGEWVETQRESGTLSLISIPITLVLFAEIESRTNAISAPTAERR